MHPPFSMTCDIVTTTRDEWSDYTNTATTSTSCHFREIDTLTRSNRGEENDADAMVWFPVGTTLDNGTIVQFNSKNYQIERITQARRLGSPTVQFIKCDLKTIEVA